MEERGEALQRRAGRAMDALGLLRAAERLGVRSRRAAALRARLRDRDTTEGAVDRLSVLLRRYVAKRRAELIAIDAAASERDGRAARLSPPRVDA